MTTEEMLCRWAERRYGIPKVASVEFIYDEGWPGTDVTPGDPPEFSVRVIDAEGRAQTHGGFRDIPEMINEIVEFVTRAASRDSQAPKEEDR